MSIIHTWLIPINVIAESVLKIPIGASTLALELAKLAKLQGLGMPEAIAFYAGRIVEDLAQQALSKSNLQHGNDLDTNLNLLFQWGRIDEGALASGHMLRRLGNQARHLDRAIEVSEEPTIVGLLQLWLEWYTRNFTNVQKHDPAAVVAFGDWSSLTPLLRLLALGKCERIGEEFTSSDTIDVLLADASIAGFAGERLIDCRNPQADEFTKQAKVRFPNERRITQIRALYFSRNGSTGDAVTLLQHMSKFSRHDSETFGILGGAYKNLWTQTQDPQFLQKAHQQYEKGAREFPADYYLRINVAATSLWLGERHQARAQANEALQILANFGFTGNKGDIPKNATYWVVATLAEANLLAEKYPKAFSLYEQACALDITGGRWARTATQLRLHLEKLGDMKLSERFSAMLAGKAA